MSTFPVPPGSNEYAIPSLGPARAEPLGSGQSPGDTQPAPAAAVPPPGPISGPIPTTNAARADTLDSGHPSIDTQVLDAAAVPPPGSSERPTPIQVAARAGTLDSGQGSSDTHRVLAAAVTPPGPSRPPTPTEDPARADALLLICADLLGDLEATRIANANRLRALTTPEIVGDKGGTFGKGIGDLPEVARIAGLVDSLAALEHGAELELKRALRKHPYGAWVKATAGVGEKQGARLLAAIGDPYIHPLHDRPRTVSELWAFAGYHVLPVAGQNTSATQRLGADGGQPLHPGQAPIDTHTAGAGVDPSSDPGRAPHDAQWPTAGVAPSRRKGVRANWNAAARMRAYLVAEACMKCRTSPYRAVYDNGRAKYAESTHNAPCVRCGPSGHPAPTGSPLSLGHQHARALRLVAKAVLRDLWLEGRRLHEAAA